MTYISSQSLTSPIRQSVQQIQSAMAKVTIEQSTGVKADIGLSLGAQTGTALSLQSQMDQLTSFKNTNSLASTRLSSTANTLSNMVSSAQEMAQAVVEATGVGSTGTLQTSAQDALQSLTGSLNTSSAGQFIFGGINTGTPPLAATASTDLQTSATAAFQSYLTTNGLTASTISGTQMQSFLDTNFSALFNSSNWTTSVSQASNTQIQTQISPSQSMTTSVSANDPSIRQVAQAYTMLAAFTNIGLSASATTAVTSSSAKLISSGMAGLNNSASAIGIAQSTLDTTNTQITSQVDLLTTSVSDLESVDPTVLQTEMVQLQNQLTASYSLTNRLSQLSLVNYLSS